MPSKAGQLINWPLPTINFVASGNDRTLLNQIPKTLLGRLVHLVGVDFEVQYTPTTAGAADAVGHNNIVRGLRITDGKRDLFNGTGFNALRMREILEFGKVINPDPDDGATTVLAAFNRSWHSGPPMFDGAPSDFAIPASALESGQIDYTFGAITDVAAGITVLTGTIRPIARLMLLDEIRVPAAYEWREYAAGAADFLISGRALYAFLAAYDSNAYGAIAAGDFGAFTVDCGLGQVVPNVDAEILTRCYQGDMFSGQATEVQGEPRAAADDNAKSLNEAGAGFASSTARVNPVLWSPEGSRISKILAHAESALRIQWSGSQTTAVIAAGRILEQPPSVVATYGAAALGKLSLRDRATKIKTISKEEYRGPRPEFMPYKIAVR